MSSCGSKRISNSDLSSGCDKDVSYGKNSVNGVVISSGRTSIGAGKNSSADKCQGGGISIGEGYNIGVCRHRNIDDEEVLFMVAE